MNALSRFVAFTMLATASFLSADGFAAHGGPERRETRAVSGFHAIRLAVPARLELTQGEVENLAIEGAEKVLANIETVVEDGTLVIRALKPMRTWHGKVRIQVGARRIDGLSIAGAGDIHAPALRGPAMNVSIAGAGDVRIGTLETERAEIHISGSGGVRVGGRTTELSTRISGSGDVHAERLDARRVKVSIAGSGGAGVWARESLAVNVSGSGDVRYHGEPSIAKTIRGSGTLKKAGAAPS